MAATITLCVCIVVCASVDNKLHDVTCLCVDYKHMHCFVYVQDTLPQSQTLMDSWKHHNKPKICFINPAECENSCRHIFTHAKFYEHPQMTKACVMSAGCDGCTSQARRHTYGLQLLIWQVAGI